MWRKSLYPAIGLAFMGVLSTTGAQAASMYVMDRSDHLPDGVGYLQVTIADGADGAIDFTVTPTQALLDRAGGDMEIRSFALNVAPELNLTAANFVGLPDKWSARGTTRLDGFGRFDFTLMGTGPGRIDTLTFSIVGIEGDTPLSYVNLSTGNAKEGNSFFAARIRDLLGDRPCGPGGTCTSRAIPTAFVGLVGETAPIPLPTAAWLIAPGLGLLAPWVKRRPAA